MRSKRPKPKLKKYIGNGPIRRLNPRLPWDELDEDIKNVIKKEEDNNRIIIFSISDSIISSIDSKAESFPEDHSLIEGNFSDDQIENIYNIHKNLQFEIKRIENMTEEETEIFLNENPIYKFFELSEIK